jgi:asparagine synthase (glutamine-hydrolysing)
MCGISGIYSFNSEFPNLTDVKKMTSALSHRGPDAEDFFVNQSIVLGHRRLSIIDLSSAANQPMKSANGRYVIVFNGEVYNFKDIAKELNIHLRTTSDTEVILEAFAKWGMDCIHKFNGMFAFGIYDLEKEELYLVRDRLGVKPLFYYKDAERLIFASELKAFKELDIEKELNKKAISNFLHLGFIPAPQTIFSNIYKLPAGSYLLASKNNCEIKPYWKPEDQIKSTVLSDKNEATKELEKILISSINYRLISDVPFGSFLSGGIDSSLVTAIAQSQSSNPLKTFTIGFEENRYDESKYAREVANHLGTNHQEYKLSYNEALELIPDIIKTYDEPYADSSAIPTMLISKLARQEVKMVLSGDGGDELFMGYGSYKWANRLNNPLINFLKTPVSAALSSLSNKYKRAGYLFKYQDKKTLKSHIFSQEQYMFSTKEVEELVCDDYKTPPNLEETISSVRKLSSAEEQALFDLRYYLPDDLLVKTDRAGMKYSLEIREPLLDYRLVEFALNLSPELKLKNSMSKILLKEVLYKYVPKEIFDRPKQGFAIPLQSWLKKELAYLIDEYLHSLVINKYKGEDYLYNRLWLLIVLHMWLEKNTKT